jgi:hypothetical protein
MNPRSPTPSSFWNPARFAALLLTTCLLGAESKPTPSTEPPKEYIVFVGADVMTEHQGKPHRVVGAIRSSLELKAGAETQIVPYHRLDGFHIVRGRKLGTFKANVDSMRATSLTVALNRQNAEFQFDAMAATNAQERSLQEAKTNLQIGQMALGPQAARTEERQQQITEASKRLEETRDLLSDYDAKRPDERERHAQLQSAAAEAAPELHALVPDLPFTYQHDPAADGFQLKCAISSPHPLEKPYLAVTLHYLDPRDPARKRMRTTVLPLDRITEKPRKVTVSLTGMPLGFRLIGCHFDLYGNGHEVATNVSKAQPAMTEEEVYQYFLREYLANNRDKTRPPVPLLLAPAGELRPQVNAAELDQVIYVRVDEHGNVVSLSTDETGAREVPPQILSVLRSVRFFPGLKNGTPIESRAQLKLADLLR